MAMTSNPTKKHYTEHQLHHAALILGESIEYLKARLVTEGGNSAPYPLNNTLNNNNNYNTFQDAVVLQRPSGQPSAATTSTDAQPIRHDYAISKYPSTPTSIPFQAKSSKRRNIDAERSEPAGYTVHRPLLDKSTVSLNNQPDSSLIPFHRPQDMSTPLSRDQNVPAASTFGGRLHFRTSASYASFATTPSSFSDGIPPSPAVDGIPQSSSNEPLPPFNASGSSTSYGVHLDDQLSSPLDIGEGPVDSFVDPLRGATTPSNIPQQQHSDAPPINAQLYLMNGEPSCTRQCPEGTFEGHDRHKRVRSNQQVPSPTTEIHEMQRAVASASPGSDSMNNPKSCLRCRFQHLKCVPDPMSLDGPCLSCKKLKRPTLSRLPCFWLMMTDAFLYRDQVAPNPLHTNRWMSMQVVNVDQWEDSELKTVRVGHVAMDKSYPLRVRRFKPLRGDQLDERWVVKGIEKRHALAPYAIADMPEAVAMFRKYIVENIVSYVKAFVNTNDLLYKQTYIMAYRMAYAPEYESGPTAISEEERLLLREAFQLWVCCRKTSNPERFFGAERLGVDVVEDPNSPWYNTAPIPPLMIAQMQCIFYSHFLPRLQKSVLERLWSLCKRTQHKHWLTIYLTEFILLHSASMITRRNNEYAKSLGSNRRYFNPGAITKLQDGCNNLLAHYHYFNKGRLFFQQALQPSGLQEIVEETGLDSQQAAFVKMTANSILARKSAMDDVRNHLQFEDDSFWISQLYMKGWSRSATA